MMRSSALVGRKPKGQPTATCEVCGLAGPARRHPCRFEVACACWYGVPCDGSGRIKTPRGIRAATGIASPKLDETVPGA